MGFLYHLKKHLKSLKSNYHHHNHHAAFWHTKKLIIIMLLFDALYTYQTYKNHLIVYMYLKIPQVVAQYLKIIIKGFYFSSLPYVK